MRDWSRINRDAICTCGYNMRGLQVNSLCPECGAKPRWRVRGNFGITRAFARKIAARTHNNVRYSRAALRFTQELLAYARITNPPGAPVDARAMCDAFPEYAMLVFGDVQKALHQLSKIGLRRSEDVGAMVYALVAAKCILAEDHDRLEDFDGRFDLKTVFD